ncbi:FAD-dependent monooxygenase [Streptomyces sp. NPDC058955]|uniref:FAD-dependent monooxygenase n=1 Tax=unclassified Streptomyces TaxID=2593676 RepID=UPI0036569658
MGNTAVVVGGGIGGLAAAIGLRRVGWDVTVVERAPVLDDAGAGISLAANGLRALDALGVGAGVRDASRGQYSGGTRTPRGSWLTRMDGAALERAVGTPIMGIPRSTLHRLLRAGLPAEALLIGAEVDSVTGPEVVPGATPTAGPGATSTLAPGAAPAIDLEAAPATAPARPAGSGPLQVHCGDRILDADLVVAADGIGSKLRGLLFPAHPGPVHSGSTVLRALTERPVDLRTDFELTWGRGAEFGHIAFTDGRAEWHAVLDLPAGVRFADPLAELRRRFDGWHEPIPALLDATRSEAVLHHDVNELRTPLPSYAVGRIALLGDAAHAMTPHLGQGACQALEDAVALAAALAAEPTVEAALVRYDAERRPRSQAVARAARQAGWMGQQLAHPVAVALRNTAMRLTPSRAATRMILRHHAWAPPRLD